MPRPAWKKFSDVLVRRLVVLADEAAERRADAELVGLGDRAAASSAFDLMPRIWFSHGSNGARPFASIAASSMKLA